VTVEGWDDPDRRDDALDRVAAAANIHQPRTVLRPAEINVARCISHGLDRAATAETLGITYETVKQHLKTLRATLACKTTTQACCEAIRQGLIP
jgi:DNA-binding CsgD family transcriptional regulator